MATTFDVPRRGYRLLLGLRQPEAWSALRPRAIDASIEGLRRSFQVVVADVTGDVEGEAEGGSADVEERNHLARSAALHSSVVVVVGAPGMKGVYSLAASGAVVDRHRRVAGSDRAGDQPVAAQPAEPGPRSGAGAGQPAGGGAHRRAGPDRRRAALAGPCTCRSGSWRTSCETGDPCPGRSWTRWSTPCGSCRSGSSTAAGPAGPT